MYRFRILQPVYTYIVGCSVSNIIKEHQYHAFAFPLFGQNSLDGGQYLFIYVSVYMNCPLVTSDKTFSASCTAHRIYIYLVILYAHRLVFASLDTVSADYALFGVDFCNERLDFNTTIVVFVDLCRCGCCLHD